MFSTWPCFTNLWGMDHGYSREIKKSAWCFFQELLDPGTKGWITSTFLSHSFLCCKKVTWSSGPTLPLATWLGGWSQYLSYHLTEHPYFHYLFGFFFFFTTSLEKSRSSLPGKTSSLFIFLPTLSLLIFLLALEVWNFLILLSIFPLKWVDWVYWLNT